MKKKLYYRIFSAAVAAVMMFTVFGCKEKETAPEIALIINQKGLLNDKTFNQSANEGIQKYCDENNKVYRVYEPESVSKAQYLKQIDAAVSDGAKIIVTPGFNFEESVFEAQDKYPEIKFVLIDATPSHTDDQGTTTENVSGNTYSILYAEEQAGFLAGYAIVKDGFTKLGFLGGKEIPSIIRFGNGFVQGAEYAGKELNLADGAVEVEFGYCGNFEKKPDNQAIAASWYQKGTEVIFACGGSIGLSVMAAAEATQDKWVIGVDSDQSHDSERVITSSLKMIKNTVYSALSDFYLDKFPGGSSVHLGAEKSGVGLSIETSKFRTFTKADYESIYEKIATNKSGISDNINKDISIKAHELNTKVVTVLVK